MSETGRDKASGHGSFFLKNELNLFKPFIEKVLQLADINLYRPSLNSFDFQACVKTLRCTV